MTTSILPSLQNHYTVPERKLNNRLQYCTLQWRRSHLLVKSPGKLQQPYFPSLDNPELLVECLKHSLVSLVSIDPKLDEHNLRFWAEACKQANKPIFLNLPPNHKLAQTSNRFLRIVQRLLDRILALALLLLFAPIILGIVILMRINSPGFLFESEWYVGERGKLFLAIKFRTCTSSSIIPLGLWLRKYKLDNLPRLINVLRGEMSLLGFHCWNLRDALKVNLPEENQPDKIPLLAKS